MTVEPPEVDAIEEDGMVMSLEQIYDDPDLPRGAQGELHGRRFVCMKKDGTKFYNCCLAILAITLGSTLTTITSFLAPENYKKNDYIAFAACIVGDIVGVALMLAGGWEIKKICCNKLQLRHEGSGQPNQAHYDNVEMIEV